MSWIPTATLFLMMISLGMTLRWADFRRLGSAPSAVLVGLLGQVVLLPGLAFAIAHGLELAPVHAIGLVLIAACPGGVVSNALTQLARGDVALSISLTAASSLVSFLTLPLVISLALRAFGATVAPVELSLAELAGTLFGTTALPVALGMLVLQRRPQLAGRLHRPLLAASTGILMLLIAGLFASLATSGGELSIGALFRRVTPAIVALIGSAMAIGYFAGRQLGLGGAVARTLGLEIGIQNVNMALVVAPSFLGEQRYAGPAVVYLPAMFAFAGALIALGRRAEPGAEKSALVSR